MFRAVVFDLWQTLVTWPEEDSLGFRGRWAEWMGVDPEALDAVWYAPGAYERRETGPIAAELAFVHDALSSGADVEEVLSWRLEMARRNLAPSPEVTGTLTELRRRGMRTGLISNCTEDVALVWEQSPFAGLFDAAVFSATAGVMKPDRRIYELVLDALGVDAKDCLFVGDGANNELEGARQVGMTPVLIHPDGDRPRGDGLDEWDGLRVTGIAEVLDLVA